MFNNVIIDMHFEVTVCTVVQTKDVFNLINLSMA